MPVVRESILRLKATSVFRLTRLFFRFYHLIPILFLLKVLETAPFLCLTRNPLSFHLLLRLNEILGLDESILLIQFPLLFNEATGFVITFDKELISHNQCFQTCIVFLKTRHLQSFIQIPRETFTKLQCCLVFLPNRSFEFLSIIAFG